MRKSTLVAVLGVAALGLASGSAVTGGGLDSDDIPATAFVGGTVSQTFTGATLTSVEYVREELDQREISSIELVFEADASGKAVAIALTGVTPGAFICDDVTTVLPFTSSCTGTPAKDITSAAITVS